MKWLRQRKPQATSSWEVAISTIRISAVKQCQITEEEATLKTGIMVFNGNTLDVLCDTARVTEDTSKKRRTVKIGGLKNMRRKRYVLCFHHVDAVDGDIWVMIVGNNQSGIELAFAKDKESVIDAEFKALPSDSDGTLITYIEEDKSISAT